MTSFTGKKLHREKASLEDSLTFSLSLQSLFIPSLRSGPELHIGDIDYSDNPSLYFISDFISSEQEQDKGYRMTEKNSRLHYMNFWMWYLKQADVGGDTAIAGNGGGLGIARPSRNRAA